MEELELFFLDTFLLEPLIEIYLKLVDDKK